MSQAPLTGIRIVEFAGIGPGPFAGMMLADHGAEVIRIDRARAGGLSIDSKDPLLRGRKSISMDLKNPDAIAAVRKIVAGADAIIEGFRPGVMERLGLGPDVLLADNPKLVYGRMTGWGQTGPMAPEPGHDINYIALSGVLHALGARGKNRPRRSTSRAISGVAACSSRLGCSPRCSTRRTPARARWSTPR